MWLRSYAGRAFGNENDPFANFYFGAFGNNWIDKGEISRYREYYSFPGVQINQIGAQSFVKGQAEWDLTPLHFRDLGSTKLYFNWARLALFAGGLAANPGTISKAATVTWEVRSMCEWWPSLRSSRPSPPASLQRMIAPGTPQPSSCSR